jgi:hypothetical protein
VLLLQLLYVVLSIVACARQKHKTLKASFPHQTGDCDIGTLSGGVCKGGAVQEKGHLAELVPAPSMNSIPLIHFISGVALKRRIG